MSTILSVTIIYENANMGKFVPRTNCAKFNGKGKQSFFLRIRIRRCQSKINQIVDSTKIRFSAPANRGNSEAYTMMRNAHSVSDHFH